MRLFSPRRLWPLLGMALLAAVCGCAATSWEGVGEGGPELSCEEALARCMESTSQGGVLYPDRLAGCMEGYGWAYTGQGRY